MDTKRERERGVDVIVIQKTRRKETECERGATDSMSGSRRVSKRRVKGVRKKEGCNVATRIQERERMEWKAEERKRGIGENS